LHGYSRLPALSACHSTSALNSKKQHASMMWRHIDCFCVVVCRRSVFFFGVEILNKIKKHKKKKHARGKEKERKVANIISYNII